MLCRAHSRSHIASNTYTRLVADVFFFLRIKFRLTFVCPVACRPVTSRATHKTNGEHFQLSARLSLVRSRVCVCARYATNDNVWLWWPNGVEAHRNKRRINSNTFNSGGVVCERVYFWFLCVWQLAELAVECVCIVAQCIHHADLCVSHIVFFCFESLLFGVILPEIHWLHKLPYTCASRIFTHFSQWNGANKMARQAVSVIASCWHSPNK